MNIVDRSYTGTQISELQRTSLLTENYNGDKVILLLPSRLGCDSQEALMSVNKAILIGNLGKDPEVRFTSTGRAVARFPIATSEVWTDAEGNRQERTEWHNIIVWGKQGETCGQYLAKGRQVFVEGSIRTRNYDDKSGNKRYVTEIVAQRVRFLGGGGGTRIAPETDSGASDEMGAGGPPPADDDIPF
jgi:single-strand DNA-binding protein